MDFFTQFFIFITSGNPDAEPEAEPASSVPAGLSRGGTGGCIVA
jgi:hypothetical protein